VAELLLVLLEEVVADAVHAVVVEGWRTMILVGIDGYSRGLVIRATARASFSNVSTKPRSEQVVARYTAEDGDAGRYFRENRL
jgi:hypothetical protein